MVKLNLDEILKGIIIAVVLMVGMALGVVLRSQGVNGFIIWFVVSIINVATAIFAYIIIKKEIEKKPEQSALVTDEAKKTTKKKKNIAKSDEKEEKSESESSKFETDADKKE